MVAISSEALIMGASLSRIQAFVLSDQDPKMLIQSRPDIAAILDKSLIGCMVLFSCLEQEIARVSKLAGGQDALNWRAKARVVWKHETFQDLLNGMRGQQVALSVLLQLLQMFVEDSCAYVWCNR
jgi:hypothetical protein